MLLLLLLLSKQRDHILFEMARLSWARHLCLVRKPEFASPFFNTFFVCDDTCLLVVVRAKVCHSSRRSLFLACYLCLFVAIFVCLLLKLLKFASFEMVKARVLLPLFVFM